MPYISLEKNHNFVFNQTHSENNISTVDFESYMYEGRKKLECINCESTLF